MLRKLRQAGLLVLLTGWMVSCGTTPRSSWPLGAPSSTSPELPPGTDDPTNAPPLATAVVADPLQIATPAPLPMIEEPAAAVPSGAPTNAWVSLEVWGTENGYGKPVQVTGPPGPAFALHGTNGAIALRVGSRAASRDGFAYWLGYAPQLINGLPHVHLLDVLKNLQPLIARSSGRAATNRIIVIDPGHGGRDSGARNAFGGKYEKDLALDWALRLERLLSARGWRVYMTRTNDVTLPLPDRVAVAEQTKAALFLSLHFNSGAPNRELAGIETYCLTPAGMPSTLLRGYEDDPLQVYPNNSFDAQNFQFAFGLHRTLVQATGAVDRGVRRARFMGVLRWQNRPAILIEGGYLTNPAEARKISSPEYRQKLAEAVAKWLEE